MLVLLPPSEGKTPAPAGESPLELGALGHQSLTGHRAAVMAALAAASARPDALALLGVGASLVAEVERNTHLRHEPAARASQVYTGVLYGAAGLAHLTPRARTLADEHVRIVSALWGLVGPGDRIPAYRLSMATDLPGIGSLAPSWREPLKEVLDPIAADRLVVDCRSSAYLAAWRPRPTAHGWVTVRVLRELDGRRSVVSHHAKHTRGVLTRHLVTRRGTVPRTPAALLRVARELIGTEIVEVGLEPAAPYGFVLSLVVR